MRKLPLVKLRAQLLKPKVQDLDNIIKGRSMDTLLPLSPDLDFHGHTFRKNARLV